VQTKFQQFNWSQEYPWSGGLIVHCPYCNHEKTRVLDTSHDTRGVIRRRRVCVACNQRFSTYERPLLATPLLIKQDKRREEFSRDKLAAGIRVACAKRPVTADEIERMVGEIESDLQHMGKPEISSRIVGDQVMRRLKDLDEVAYIRYAIVYLGLEDLDAVRNEIDRLLGSKI
jgi:transcriptional repressor NrdR